MVAPNIERVLFDPDAFAKKIAARLKREHKSAFSLARDLDMPRSSICRILKGQTPNLWNYLKLSNWLNNFAQSSTDILAEAFRQQLTYQPTERTLYEVDHTYKSHARKALKNAGLSS